VAPGQIQRTEIDVGFVGLGAGRGTTAVSAKLPGVRIGAAAGATAKGAASSSVRVGLISRPAVATTKFVASCFFPVKFLRPYQVTNASYPAGGTAAPKCGIFAVAWALRVRC